MKTKIKISERERKCLEYLAKIYPHDEANVAYFRDIAKKTGLEERKVRCAVRSLARKGLTEYVRGLFDDDGMVAGSGYAATYEGAKFIDPCNDCGELASIFLDKDWEDKEREDRRMFCDKCHNKNKLKLKEK